MQRKELKLLSNFFRNEKDYNNATYLKRVAVFRRCWCHHIIKAHTSPVRAEAWSLTSRTGIKIIFTSAAVCVYDQRGISQTKKRTQKPSVKKLLVFFMPCQWYKSYIEKKDRWMILHFGGSCGR